MAARSMRLVLILLTLLALTLPAHAEKKVALVIGNRAYDHLADLGSAGPGAVAISGAFERLGFAVTLLRDADAITLRSGFAQFAIAAGDADISAIYFAGHGLQVGGETYVIPTDARSKNVVVVGFELISLDSVVSAMKWTQGPNLFFLDMCGGNAFKRMMKAGGATPTTGCGLASMDPGTGTIVSYSGKTETPVENDVDGISPYTRALLKFIEQPRLELGDLVESVRRDVMQSTDSRQEPFSLGSLSRHYHLLPALQAASVEPRASNRDEAARAWHLIRDTSDRDMIEAYLAEFGDSSRFYALLAGKRLADLMRKAGNRVTDAAPALPERSSGGQDGAVVVRQLAAIADMPAPRATVRTAVQNDADSVMAMQRSLSRSIQTELNRIGCSAGSPDGVWGKKTVSAVQSYMKNGSVTLASLEPNAALLARLRREPAGLCRTNCGKGRVPVKGRCVARTCPKGQILSSSGACRPERKAKVIAPCEIAPRRNSIGECVPSNIKVSKATPLADAPKQLPRHRARAGRGNSFKQKGVTGYTPGFCYQSARHLC